MQIQLHAKHRPGQWAPSQIWLWLAFFTSIHGLTALNEALGPNLNSLWPGLAFSTSFHGLASRSKDWAPGTWPDLTWIGLTLFSMAWQNQATAWNKQPAKMEEDWLSWPLCLRHQVIKRKEGKTSLCSGHVHCALCDVACRTWNTILNVTSVFWKEAIV